MYENIKLISCDIDGTLCKVTFDPNQRTVNTLNKLKEKGYLIGLASGRACDDLMTKAKKWNLAFDFDFLIGLNGAEVYDKETDSIHKYNLMSRDDIKEVIELMQEFHPNTHMYKPGIYLSSHESDRAWFSAYKNSRKYVVTNDLSDFYKNDEPGIMFRCNKDDMPAIEEKFVALSYKPYKGFKSQADLYEFTNRECSKGNALIKYAKLKGIDLNDVMAFGETTNDNEMLKCCHGICMLNGTDDTKACAEMITEKVCIDDGFAEFIERYILND